MKALIAITALLFLDGCPPPCQVKATRCNGNLVEVCGSNQKWQRALDCSQVKATKPGVPQTWVCGELPTGHNCVPQKAQ